jgi:CheY-like chemotaxis protein
VTACSPSSETRSTSSHPPKWTLAATPPPRTRSPQIPPAAARPLDLNLPGRSGLDVCRDLRLDERRQEVPIIIRTGQTHELSAALGAADGADRFRTKPLRPRELVAEAHRLTDGGARRSRPWPFW